jgi:hypothetical protein
LIVSLHPGAYITICNLGYVRIKISAGQQHANLFDLRYFPENYSRVLIPADYGIIAIP